MKAKLYLFIALFCPWFSQVHGQRAMFAGHNNYVAPVAIQPVVLGANYGGGIVIYLFTSGDAGYVSGETHGLIAATQNQVTGGSFADVNNNLNNPLYHAIAGQQYTDWRIPSLLEIQKLYAQKNRFGTFDEYSYYIINVPATFTNTSSSFYAYDMANGNSGAGFPYPCHLRAVRTF